MGAQRFPRMVGRLGASCALALLAAAAALPARNVPTEKVGVSNVETANVALSADFDMAQGRNLRMRKVTILPGGSLPMHSHADRPSVSYVLSGVLTEYVAGEAMPRTIRPGGSNSSFARDHALLNRGRHPVDFIEVDLIRP